MSYKIPQYSTDLIKQLDAQYPNGCIRRGESLEDAHRRAGNREVIENLKICLDRQTKHAKENLINVHS